MKNIGRVSLYFMLACVVTNSNAMQVEDQQLTINVNGVVATEPGAKPGYTIQWLPNTPNPSPGTTPETQPKRDFKSALLAVNSGNQASSRRNSQKPEVSEKTVLGELAEHLEKEPITNFSPFCRQEDTAFQLACIDGDEKTINAYLDVLYGIPLLSTEQIQSLEDAMTYVRRYYWQYNVRLALYNTNKLGTIKTLLGHRAITETIWAGTFISITEICDMVHKHQASVDIVQYLVGYLQEQPESPKYLKKTVEIACEQYLTRTQDELQTLHKEFNRSLQLDQEKERLFEQEKERRASRSPSRSKLQAQVQPQQAKWTTSPPVPKSSFDQDNNVVTIVASPSLSTRTAASPRKDLNPLHPAHQVTETGSSSGTGSSRRDSLPKLGEAPDPRLLTVPAYLND